MFVPIQGWDSQARDIMRMVATLQMALGEDPVLHRFQLPAATEQVQGLFAAAACLSKAITIHRLRTIDPRLVPPRETEQNLVDKDDLKLLQDRIQTGKLRGKGYRYRPYHS